MGLLGDNYPTIARDSEEHDKINYRSVGRGDGGVMRKRRPRVLFDPNFPTASSIPTQYETRLYRNNRESRGFSSRTPRFDVARVDEAPGPGAYLEECAHAGRSPAACVGLRGANAFASRTPRLDPKVRGAPTGPGDYEVVAASAPTTGLPPSTRSAPSAAFVEPASTNPANYYVRPSPGPGEYLGNDHTWGPRGAAHAVGAAMPKSARAMEDRREPTGAVAAGGARAATPVAGRAASMSSRRVTSTPPPRSPHRRPTEMASPRTPPRPGSKGTSVPPPPPPHPLGDRPRRKLVQMPPPSPLHGMSEAVMLKVGSKLLEQGQPPRGPPGPGDYDPQTLALKAQTDFSRLGSSSFQLGTSHLPRTWRAEPPGPCEYELPESPSGRAAAICGVGPRFKDQKKLVPGPAYYTPQKGMQQSFHLNIQKNWL